jgi:hypothetical protein
VPLIPPRSRAAHHDATTRLSFDLLLGVAF